MKIKTVQRKHVHFQKSSVTVLLSNVKRGPKITPINYADLAVWERKYLHSPKTWECVTKTKQSNKLGPAHSSRGLKQWTQAEKQCILIVMRVVQHGNVSSGTHPYRNVPAFWCQCYQAMSVCPFLLKYYNPIIPQRGHLTFKYLR